MQHPAGPEIFLLRSGSGIIIRRTVNYLRVLMTKFLELILIILVLRSVLPMIFPRRKPKSNPVQGAPPKEKDPFRKKADISDGEFEDLR
jgi:hypothetical protein